MPSWSSDIYCPKCKSRYLSIDEKCFVVYNYEAEDGIVEFDGIDERSVETISLTCTCNVCGHIWHPDRDFLGERID